LWRGYFFLKLNIMENSQMHNMEKELLSELHNRGKIARAAILTMTTLADVVIPAVRCPRSMF
jgi:hypothetical protein